MKLNKKVVNIIHCYNPTFNVYSYSCWCWKSSRNIEPIPRWKTHSWAKIEILFKTLIPMQGTKFCAFPDLQTCHVLISSFNLLDDVVLIQRPLVRLYMWPHIMMWQQVKATKKERNQWLVSIIDILQFAWIIKAAKPVLFITHKLKALIPLHHEHFSSSRI